MRFEIYPEINILIPVELIEENNFRLQEKTYKKYMMHN